MVVSHGNRTVSQPSADDEDVDSRHQEEAGISVTKSVESPFTG